MLVDIVLDTHVVWQVKKSPFTIGKETFSLTIGLLSLGVMCPATPHFDAPSQIFAADVQKKRSIVCEVWTVYMAVKVVKQVFL